MLGVALAIGLWRTIPRSTVRLHLKAIDTKITVGFGDLFESPGVKVVPVNEFFDSDLGDHVAHRSLHGQLISRLFSGHPASFNALVDAELANVPHDVVSRASGRQKRYFIGTTPMITAGEQPFLLLALCHTDLGTLKASCDVPTLWMALSGLWAAVRNRAGGRPVVVPLIGGGLAGIGLPPSQLLQIIVLSLVTASRQSNLVSPITIVLPQDRFDEIDLAVLDHHWS
jgi:hypothetical protein